jgi:hypothetical protein
MWHDNCEISAAEAVAEMIFAGMLGASVIYATEKSHESLDRSVNALINYLGSLAPKGPGGDRKKS